MLGLLLAAMLAAQPPPAQGPGTIVFARGHLEGWSMKATNVVANGRSGPVIDRMLCEIERDGLRAMTWRQGDVSFIFEGSRARGGRTHQLRHRDVRALIVDGVTYDVERHDDDTLTDRYSDVVYPDSQIVYPPSGVYSMMARRRGSDLWLHSGNIADELIDARQLRVGFREGEAGPMIWIDMPMTGLAGALGWCHAAMTSPAALRLHPS